jgi:hypothetical protein
MTIAVLVTLLAACTPLVFLGGGPPVPRSTSWDEEALLADGRTVRVSRTAYFEVSLLPTLPDQPSKTLTDQALVFIHPDQSGRKIRWRAGGPLHPAALLIDGADVYLIGQTGTGREEQFWDYPCSGYVVFKLRGDDWERMDERTLETAAIRRNLTRNAYRFLEERQFHLLTSDKVAAFNSGAGYSREDLIIDLRRVVVGKAKCFGLRPFPQPQLMTLTPTNRVAFGTEAGLPERRRLATTHNCSAYLKRATPMNGALFRFVQDPGQTKVMEQTGSQGLACTEQGIFYFRYPLPNPRGEWFLARYSLKGDLVYYGQFVPPRSPKGYVPSAVAADTLTVDAGKLTFAMMYEQAEPWPIFELQEPAP